MLLITTDKANLYVHVLCFSKISLSKMLYTYLTAFGRVFGAYPFGH